MTADANVTAPIGNAGVRRTCRGSGVLHRVPVILLALLPLSCHESVAPQTAGLDVPDRLTLLEGQVVTLTRGDSIALSVRVMLGAGGTETRPPSAYAWRSTDESVARVTAEGLVRAGPGLGETWIVVQDSVDAADSVVIWVQPPASEPSTFHITLIYADDIPDGWRTALDAAAARWEEVVRAPLLEVTLDLQGGDCPTPGDEPPTPAMSGPERGVVIYVGQSGHYPEGTYVEATGGPCLQRPLPHPTTLLGRITLNRDKPIGGIPADRLRYLAVHEMGHALGLVAVINGWQPSWFDFDSGRYTGPLALEGYRMAADSVVGFLQVTGGNHWGPGIGPDVMGTGGGGILHFELDPRDVGVINYFTVGALMDLGYPAAWYGAGGY